VHTEAVVESVRKKTRVRAKHIIREEELVNVRFF
jgi:hypothetical protein